MKNITLAVREEVLREVRRIAAERETTVNALVREYLEHLAAGRARRKEMQRSIAKFARKSKAKIGPITWSRDDTHAR